MIEPMDEMITEHLDLPPLVVDARNPNLIPLMQALPQAIRQLDLSASIRHLDVLSIFQSTPDRPIEMDEDTPQPESP